MSNDNSIKNTKYIQKVQVFCILYKDLGQLNQKGENMFCVNIQTTVSTK